MTHARSDRVPGCIASQPLADAYLAIRRGASAFERGWYPGVGLAGRLSGEQLRCRVIGNSLRELDRFLNMLIDETLVACARPSARTIRNTANKLTAVRSHEPGPMRDHARLMALGRSRTCLLYMSGHVSRGDRSGDTLLTIGWWHESADPETRTLRRVAVGDRLRLSDGEVAEAGAYYVAIADSLIEQVRRHQVANPADCRQA